MYGNIGDLHLGTLSLGLCFLIVSTGQEFRRLYDNSFFYRGLQLFLQGSGACGHSGELCYSPERFCLTAERHFPGLLLTSGTHCHSACTTSIVLTGYNIMEISLFNEYCCLCVAQSSQNTGSDW